MQTRVIVNGAYGKMGSLACDTLESHPEFQLVGRIGRDNNLKQMIQQVDAQLVIDLTRADCVYENSLTIIESGAHPVVGTSGLQEQEIRQLESLCAEKALGGIIVPNFSIGAVLMMQFAAQASKFLHAVEIVEAHHTHKLDAPSGTAMKTAELIAESRQQIPDALSLKELVAGARGASYHDIPIHSLRLPGVLAKQEVIFGNTGETLTICHNSIDRQAFMPGLILACQQVLTLDKLYYGLENILQQPLAPGQH